MNVDFCNEFNAIKNGSIEEKLKETYVPTLKNNSKTDSSLQRELENKKFFEVRKTLPCFDKQQDILDAIENNQIVLISGETGCGKTTQIPQYVLDQRISQNQGSVTRIICTQPRRISAISVAERVAEERGERCGESSVGYHVRLERLVLTIIKLLAILLITILNIVIYMNI